MEADLFRFDGWDLDLRRGRLLRRGQEVSLRPKAFELLAYLVGHAGRLVPRDELFAAIWPDVHVCDTTLATTIHEVRTTLTLHGERGIVLRTVHGRGYRVDVSAAPERRGSEAIAETPAGAGFIGRGRLLAEAERMLDAARRGFGHALVVTGEAGIGKSSLLLELARRASAQGIAVHIARGIEDDGAPPAWPWIQLLRSVSGACSDEERSALARRYPAALALLPDYAPGHRRDGRPRDAGARSSTRFATADALTGLLHERSRVRPQLLLLDDLQLADTTTLELLRHVILTLAGAPVIVIAALRQEGAPAHTVLQQLLGELHGAGRLVALAGLDPHELTELTAALSGREAKIDFVSALHARTGGNPLFAAEILRALSTRQVLDDPGAVEDAAPAAVLQLEQARLAQLGPDVLRLLERAARLGPEFAAAELGDSASEPSSGAVGALLDKALRRGVLVRGPGPERLSFARELSRQVLRRGPERS